MRVRYTLLAALFAALLGSQVVLPAEDASDRIRKEALEALDLDADAGDAGGAALSTRGTVTLSLSEDSKTGSALYTWGALGNRVSVKVSAPVDSETGSAEFLNFEGLGANNLEVEYNHINWSEIDFTKILNAGVTAEGLLRARTLLCGLHVEALGAAPDAIRSEVRWSGSDIEALWRRIQNEFTVGGGPPPSQELVLEFFDKGPEANSPETENFDQYPPVRLLEQLSTALDPPCDLATWKKIEKFLEGANNPEIQRRGQWLAAQVARLADRPRVEMASVRQLKLGGIARREFLDRPWNSFFGATATIGHKKFDFLDKALLEASGEVKKIDSRETPWSFGIQGGWVRVADDEETSDGALILSLTAEQGYKEEDQVESCKLVEGFESVSALESCESVALGAPSEIDAIRLGVEWRKKNKEYAWALRVYLREKDGDSDNAGFELPIYFARDKKKDEKDSSFTGGIRFSWNDDDGEAVAIFVGKAFKVEPN